VQESTIFTEPDVRTISHRDCAFRLQKRSPADGSLLGLSVNSTNSSADKPPSPGARRINIGWKTQGVRFPRPEAQ
jgi:hypothetical protein